MTNSIQSQYGRLISLSMPCPGITPNDLLLHARGQPRFFWESARDGVAFAGMGSAIELLAWGEGRFGEIEAQARDVFANAVMLDMQESLAAPRLFGGFAFHNSFVPDLAWADFAPAHLVLPHYQLVRAGSEYWLTLNVQVPENENPYALRDELRAALQARIDALRKPAPAPRPQPRSQLNYPMPFSAWASAIEAITQQASSGALKKVVLARIAEAQFDAAPSLVRALAQLNHTYPDTYRFLFEPRPGQAFLGATPELLAQVHGSQIETMALAGSIKRGANQAEDAELAAALLDSSKDRLEHQIVIDQLQARLIPLTKTLTIEPTGVLALSNIQHLHTPVYGELRQASGILPIIAALHPTPALGGEPQAVAMDLIAELEPAPRGWYAAPVGWVDQHMQGQFAVAIRSAVVQNRQAWLYAGAGIVAASDPQREWDETLLKFRPMLRAFGNE
jgi:menaquinone-specific isochorismate synthase